MKLTLFRHKQGMTLIELLLVVSIISLLLSLLTPALRNFTEMRKTMMCMNNLRQIGVAMHLYANDNKDMFPLHYVSGFGDSGDWRRRADAYIIQSNRVKTMTSGGQAIFMTRNLADSQVWWCPKVERIVDNPGTYKNHYGLNPYATLTYSHWKLKRSAVPNPAKTILVGEQNANQTSVNAAEPPTYSEKGVSEHRISHHRGKGANYLFVDGHVDYIKGPQGIGNSTLFKNCITNTQKMWRWW
jgi:prepilin-type N-terminal cleavage/methylation domain-containing protein/prepilin-type processing-associated H-X9-DG protein